MPFPSTLYVKAIALTLLLVSGQSTATAAYQDFVHKESFQAPRQWVEQGPAPANASLVLRISLNQPSFQALENKLYAVSDPDSSEYGCYLSKEDVLQYAAPSTEGLDAVNQWLRSLGFDVQNLPRSLSNDSIKVPTTVSKAGEMLNTKYSVYRHSSTGEEIIRTTNWSVPKELDQYIDLVTPTTLFVGQTRAKVAVSSAATSRTVPPVASIPSRTPVPVDPACNETITPTCIFALYNASTYRVQSPRSHIAITAYIGQFANFADFKQFTTRFRPEAENSSFNVISINGGQNNQTLSEAGQEADLDVEYAYSLSFPIQATMYTTGGSPPFLPDFQTLSDTNEPYLNWVDHMLSQEDSNMPQTISTSYGDDEQAVPPSYAQKVCQGLAQIGARGASLFFASGDLGVGDGNPDPASTTCQSNDGRNRTEFIPAFPSSCPYITSVGATVDIPERATTRFFSGGGFSNRFTRPSYQDNAVSQYLRFLGNTNHGLYNKTGRAYPDVSALGDNYAYINNGTIGLIGGTSAAAPTFAGIVSLLNDARIAANMPPLGFFNPILYKKAFKGLNDITIGSNPGCGTNGFSCTTGWDPVTGFGTPDFESLKEIVLQIPAGRCAPKL